MMIEPPARVPSAHWCRRVLRLGAWAAALIVATGTAQAAAPSPYVDDMTWTELRARMRSGATTVLVPIGGTEQSGPHMALGKHNVRVRLLAAKIAQGLGNAVVAPVLAYVPEGNIDPPTAHMRFTGTISIPEAAFEAVLEATARSFRQHGFKEVVFLGDHGGYQKSEERVADRLNREWARHPGCRVLALTEYYRVTQGPYVEALKSRGFSADEIGTHAGVADTSLSLALDPALVRVEMLASGSKLHAQDGVYGDPRRASAELGQLGVQGIVDASVAAIRAFARAR